MPITKYLKISIDGQEMDLTTLEDSELSISYKLEDREDFQKKKSSNAVSLRFPATLNNDKISNTLHDPAIEDFTDGTIFKGYRGCRVEAYGYDLLVGKAFLRSAKHTILPTSYEYDFYGNNADWMIDLQEKTLYDYLSYINFTFNKLTIVASWNYDGTDPNLPYCFVPIRYRQPFDTGSDILKIVPGIPPPQVNDYNIKPDYLRPSLSAYYIIFKAFASLGYKVKSTFFDSAYFRRMIMPWTWGNFLLSDGSRLDGHKFLAKSTSDFYVDQSKGTSSTYIADLRVSNSKDNGGFNNNKDYSYNLSTLEMTYQYKPPQYGVLDATFSMKIQVDATVAGNSDCEMRIQWFKNGVLFDGGDGTQYQDNGNLVFSINNNSIGRADEQNIEDMFCHTQVNATDNGGSGTIITAKVYFHIFSSALGRANCRANVLQFQLDYFKIPLGGTIDFQNYLGFKKHKFLDFFRGVVDIFNLSVQTDSINKIIFIEPTHPYGIPPTPANGSGIVDLGEFNEDFYFDFYAEGVEGGGSYNGDFNTDFDSGGFGEIGNGNIPLQSCFFNEDFLDWSLKQDLEQESTIESFADSEREINFKFKNDSADGLVKLIQDRNQNLIGCGKYVLPGRFKNMAKKDIGTNGSVISTGNNDVENRFFGAVMHCDIPQWDGIKGKTTQMVAIIPENISNTSESEAGNTFLPKMIYYKGTVNDMPFIFDGDGFGNYPFAFAVNYTAGGELDPVLSYSDELINNKIVPGLLRKFYLQRMAILRNGQFYNTFFHINNKDISNYFHREHIICRGQRWELIEINNYKPLLDQSTSCYLRKWTPITRDDSNNIYPSAAGIILGINGGPFDVRYSQLKCLPSDIPKI